MDLPHCKAIRLEHSAGILTLTLNRPDKRNAMNSEMVGEIQGVVDSIRDDPSIRAVVFRGAGGNFCAGGDISGMKLSAMDEKQRAQAAREFNRDFGRMVTRVNRSPQIIVAVLEGAVMGGGLGLACISDLAITDRNARFAMPETGLGIIPAQIAPFVVTRIGLTHARRLALLGEQVNGEGAYRLGIAHVLTQAGAELERALADALRQIRSRAPNAMRATKKLLFDVGNVEHEELLDAAADAFTQALLGDEGKEGTAAFLGKRKPSWAADDETEG